jgi:hypothetical protein
MHQCIIRFAIAVTFALSLTHTAAAASFFVEDFSDNSPGPNMALGAGFGAPTTDFTGDFTITSGPNSRIYLGTNDTDYSSVHFKFESLVTVPNTTDPWAIAFMGMGTTTPNAGFFGEPSSPHLMMNLRNDSGVVFSGDNGANVDQGAVAGSIPNGTHLLRMTWNPNTQMARFDVDIANNGSIDKTFTLDGSDNGFNAGNTQLYVGGGNGLTFDNISIVSSIPEPSTLALGILGIGALAIRRQRRSRRR